MTQLSRGDVREDGHIFWHLYGPNDQEYWVTPWRFFQNRWVVILNAAKSRAIKKGVPFDLDIDHILDIYPEDGKCPVFGVDLEFDKITNGKPSWNQPSLDRIRPAAGYTKGNIRITSYRANVLRNDASVEELKALLVDAEKLGGANG